MTIPASLRKAVERNDLEAPSQIIAVHPDQAAMLNQLIPFERQRGFLLPGVGNPEDIGSCLRQAAASG